MELICDYMDNAELRHKLNGLTRSTFGFNFESWVTGGYSAAGDYIPYSLLENDTIVSNVSANRMRFLQKGVERRYIQIGTVMTDTAFRRRGLARSLMERVVGEYEGKCDGIYLFGDLGALDFYRKLGFREGLQYRYTLKRPPRLTEPQRFFRRVDGADAGTRQGYEDTVARAALSSSLEQTNKFGLQMFYTAGLKNVYYAQELDCFIVYTCSGGVLTLQSVIAKEPVPLREVLARIGQEYDLLRLGFSPLPEDAPLFTAEPWDGGADYRLFYRGEALEGVAADRLFFPALSHA